MQNTTTASTATSANFKMESVGKHVSFEHRKNQAEAYLENALTVESPSVLDTNGVIQSDVIKGLAQITFVSAETTIKSLVTARDFWEKNTLRKANDELYEILAKCLTFYEKMAQKNESGLAKRREFNNYFELTGHKVIGGSHTLTKIVKCVFGNDRRRASCYSIALRAALDAGVKSNDLPNYIRQAGGIEQLCLSNSPTAMTVKAKAEAALSAVAEKTLGTFSPNVLSKNFDVGKSDMPVVLLGTWQADGSIIVRKVVTSDGAIQAALVSCHSRNKGQIVTKNSEDLLKTGGKSTAAALLNALDNSCAV